MQRPFRGRQARPSGRRGPLPSFALLLVLTLAALLPGTAPTAAAQEAVPAVATDLEVHVISKGAKLIGTSMGGVRVLVEDADTGEVLARGVTAGSTGDTRHIMGTDHGRNAPLATGDGAAFTTTLELRQPRRLRFVAYGPLAQRQAANEASVTQWVVPGKHLTGGDGVLLEIPGFAVDALAPRTHSRLSGLPREVPVEANVTMMCGCPIEPGGLWNADGYEIGARVLRNGSPFAEIELPYAGAASHFVGTFQATEPGLYEITVYAYDPENGNTGVDFTTVILGE